MRVLLIALVAAAFAASALAEQPGRPGEGQGLGPGQGQPPPRVNTLEPPQPSTGCDPSFGGKYADLIRRIPVPEDAQRYGRCHDYGAWSGSEYKGHTNLPPGAFWTYSAPDWYIWGKHAGTAAQAGCADPSFGGKYSSELRRLEIPQDRGRYGACYDYGPWSGNEYLGHTDLPNGYWVYSFPFWIIYATSGQPGK